MCGIAGIWSEGRVDEIVGAVERMVERQRHRGPDEQRTAIVRTGASTLCL